MANSIAKLAILLTADTAGMVAGFTKAKGLTSGFAASMKGMGGSGAGGGMGGMLAGISTKAGLAGAGIAAFGAVVAGGTWAVKLAADAQQMETAFEVMLGSADKAKAMMSDIQSFAASTPFETAELAGATKSLLAFGVAQEQVIPSMRMLGDLSSGLGIPIGELSELYGKAKVQGRLFMEDINQLTGRGIPIITQLAKNFGVAESEIRGMVERGQVGFPQLQAALFELTKEGSQFGGMMEKQSQTFWGQLSTLWDNIKIAVGGIGSQFIGILTEMLKLVNAALESWNKFWGNTPDGGGKAGKQLDMKVIQEGMKPMEKVVDKAKEAAEAAAKAFEDMKKRGESLTQSLRTPLEQFSDSMAEYNDLLNAGAISSETYARAMAKAKNDLAAQSRSAQEIRDSLQRQNGPIAALQYGTQAAISAINQSQRDQKLEIEVQRQMVAEQRKANDLLNKILHNDDDGINVTEVNL